MHLNQKDGVVNRPTAWGNAEEVYLNPTAETRERLLASLYIKPIRHIIYH